MNRQITNVSESIDHEQTGNLFIREDRGLDENEMVERTEFVVLYADSGEYAGNISDGSDCTFETIEEARAYMAGLVDA